ncbi:ATP-binding cassette domain-containing protein [Caballeronia sp. LZ065]|uniref:ABC transporter ATP-binding protein n=1 Tax=Caballeronia sp. LZ065 TaxID=3038571 RepID=UPI002861E34B|nr:ATP-binding cassette domain-containing protein [Caballeronia sp. LZ065]MDR5781148.1 ATP-binding cassette domain-containing protein [Caballeronia sp. LZ065]
MSAPVLSVRNLRAGYGQRPILRDISFDVHPGEIVALLGRNGAGKSTTLLAIAGFIADAQGQILLDGHALDGAPHERARRGAGLVIKGRSLFASLTVAENMRLANLDADALLGIFPELESRLDVQAGQLSGGEQQMTAVARALLRRPRVVLLDELTFGLSPAMSQRVVDAVVRRAHGDGIAVLAVEQHIHIAERIATHAVIVAEGSVKLHVARDELVARAGEIEAIYLGHAIDV